MPLSSQCLIGSNCTNTNDCCPYHIGEHTNGVLCEESYNLSKEEEKYNICCIEKGYKCVINADCCGPKTECIRYFCVDSKTQNNDGFTADLIQETEESIFSAATNAANIDIIWLLIAICGICFIAMLISCYVNIVRNTHKNKKQMANSINNHSHDSRSLHNASEISENGIEPKEYKIKLNQKISSMGSGGGPLILHQKQFRQYNVQYL